MRYKGVFFDLDGTLLPLDLDEFINRYFLALAEKVASHVEPRLFLEVLLEATEKMLYNDGSKTNQEAFMEAFSRGWTTSPKSCCRSLTSSTARSSAGWARVSKPGPKPAGQWSWPGREAPRWCLPPTPFPGKQWLLAWSGRAGRLSLPAHNDL